MIFQLQRSRFFSIPFFAILFVLLAFVNSAFSETIIAFGDSLTEGCGDPSVYYYSCGWQGRDDTYPLYLEQLAAENHQEIVVKNFGWGGDTTSEGVNGLDTVLDDPCNAEVDYLLLLEGTNDLLFHHDIAVVQYNLRQMIKKIRDRGIVPLLATITPDPDHEWKDILSMNDSIRSLAVEEDVILVDLYDEMAPHWDRYTHPQGCYNDNLHPNPLGFQDMARTWYATLSDMLEKPTLSWLNLLLNSH